MYRRNAYKYLAGTRSPVNVAFLCEGLWYIAKTTKPAIERISECKFEEQNSLKGKVTENI
jgi:hypothetical protein